MEHSRMSGSGMSLPRGSATVNVPESNDELREEMRHAAGLNRRIVLDKSDTVLIEDCLVNVVSAASQLLDQATTPSTAIRRRPVLRQASYPRQRLAIEPGTAVGMARCRGLPETSTAHLSTIVDHDTSPHLGSQARRASSVCRST